MPFTGVLPGSPDDGIVTAAGPSEAAAPDPSEAAAADPLGVSVAGAVALVSSAGGLLRGKLIVPLVASLVIRVVRVRHQVAVPPVDDLTQIFERPPGGIS